MTKDEAMSEILKVRETNLYWDDSQAEIRKIIDQIDQPPAEFTVRELCELIAATHVNYPDQSVELFRDGSWICGKHDGPDIESLRVKLIELAKPPKPTTIMVELPMSVARCCAEYYDGEVAKACKAALEKAGHQAMTNKELDILKRKAAAFDAILEHEFTLSQIGDEWAAWDCFDDYLYPVGRHSTALEAAEKAIEVLKNRSDEE